MAEAFPGQGFHGRSTFRCNARVGKGSSQRHGVRTLHSPPDLRTNIHPERAMLDEDGYAAVKAYASDIN